PISTVLPIWYQQLRHIHVDDSWPESLKVELRSWLEDSHLPDYIGNLTLRNYTDSVTYLPIFMALVSTGQAQLTQLGPNLPLIKFHIKQLAEFDRRWFHDAHALMVAFLTKYKNDIEVLG
ncbi:MAG: hypothetical protein NWQ54_14285, partial [Paraglaciecola sp.]|nr:hypothetical protein [Paraglaciecola sp.]